MDQVQSGTFRERVNAGNDGGGSNMWKWILIVVLVIAIGAGAFFFFTRGGEEPAENETNNTETFPTSEPEPTEEEVDLTAYKIEVLNGTEVEGEAGKLKGVLETAGFTVPSVGNADKKDYPETIIQAKADVSEAFINKLKEELEGTYTVGSTEELDEGDEHDIVIIIGGLEAEEDDTEDEEASDEADTADPTEAPSATPTP